jgi:hypothetical protein
MVQSIIVVPTQKSAHAPRNFNCRQAGIMLDVHQKDSRLSLPGLGNCFTVRSGRAGLIMAIQALRLPPDARIGVPLYCCAVVFQAVIEAGCTPSFIDIELETFCISPPQDLSSKRSQIAVVIAVHMFGNLFRLRSGFQGESYVNKSYSPTYTLRVRQENTA